MERPLVVTDPSENVVEIIREAGELAAEMDSPLLVLTVVTESEFDSDASVLGSIGEIERTSYDMTASSYAEQIAQTAIDDLLSEYDIEIEPIGRSVGDNGERSEAILEVAEERDCDYIFLLGQRRTPTGKAIFGDTAQSVILNFDGYVVTLSE